MRSALAVPGVRILSDGRIDRDPPGADAAAADPCRVTLTSGPERAQVKWFNRLRGFGFLTCGEGTPDIFVHMKRCAASAWPNCARPVCAGAVRARLQGHDGSRDPSRDRAVGAVLALKSQNLLKEI
jgi:hypothetical protein